MRIPATSATPGSTVNTRSQRQASCGAESSHRAPRAVSAARRSRRISVALTSTPQSTSRAHSASPIRPTPITPTVAPRAPVELIDRMMPEGSRPKPSQPPTRPAERGVSAVVVWHQVQSQPSAGTPSRSKTSRWCSTSAPRCGPRHDTRVAAPNPNRPDLAVEGARTPCRTQSGGCSPHPWSCPAGRAWQLGELASLLPRSRHLRVGVGVRVVYEGGRGILRQILSQSARLGFTIARVDARHVSNQDGPKSCCCWKPRASRRAAPRPRRAARCTGHHRSP